MNERLLKSLKRFRRHLYSSRLLIPGLRRQHILESMVGPLGLWNQCRQYQISILQQMGLKPHHRLLDIGCGPLMGGVVFIRYLNRGNYTGLDIDPPRLNEAYRQIAREGLGPKNPTLIHSCSLGEEELEGRLFDYFWASQILYYFDAPTIARMFETCLRHANPNAVFLGDIIGPLHGENRTHEMGWQLHTISSLQKTADDCELKIEDVGSIGEFGYPRGSALRTNILFRIRMPERR